MTDNTCNGWSNYETWLVYNYLDAYNQLAYWYAQVSEHTTAYDLAKDIREVLVDATPDIGPGLYADFLRAALQEVNWREIANHVLDESPACMRQRI